VQEDSGAEATHQRVQFVGQPGQALGVLARRLGQFRHQLRIAMNLADMAVDVLGHLVLFFRRRGDLRVHVANDIHRLANLPETVTGQADAADRLLRHFNAGMHLLGYLGCTAGQVA